MIKFEIPAFVVDKKTKFVADRGTICDYIDDKNGNHICFSFDKHNYYFYKTDKKSYNVLSPDEVVNDDMIIMMPKDNYTVVEAYKPFYVIKNLSDNIDYESLVDTDYDAIVFNGLDKGIKELVENLNLITGIKTISSCEGHNGSSFYVEIEITNAIAFFNFIQSEIIDKLFQDDKLSFIYNEDEKICLIEPKNKPISEELNKQLLNEFSEAVKQYIKVQK